MTGSMESEPRISVEYPPETGGWTPTASPAVRRQPRRPLPPTVNLVFFLLTVATTLIAGTIQTLDDTSFKTVVDVLLTPSLWTLGLAYSLSLIAILGAHEMGHYVACRMYGIDATLPFFIPGPPIIGTFGAVIRIRSPFTTRRALFDVGVAGPIAGFVVSLPVLAWGLAHSRVVPDHPRPGEIGLPSCLLLDLAYSFFFPGLAPGETISLHPVFVAAWVGLLATFLNLLPVGQLDGGHMLYALSRRAHRPVSLVAIVMMISAGMVFGGFHLILFGVLWAVIGPRHPPVVDASERLGGGRVVVAAAALVIFALCFIPGSPQLF
jgi:membrane-associated protease RseP (regulator of RpoE activity)